MLLRRGWSGALFRLDRPVIVPGQVTMGKWEGKLVKGTAFMSVEAERASTDDAQTVICNQAQKALDIFAVSNAAYLTASQGEQAVYWESASDGIQLTCRDRLEVPFPWGITVGRTDRPADTAGSGKPPAWSPGFRFYRMAQSRSDSHSAFRDTFLAVEHLLSSLYPRHKEPKREKELDWLKRALQEFDQARPQIGGKSWLGTLDLASFADDVYAKNRNRVFHAKADEGFDLPYQAHSDQHVSAAMGPLTQLFHELAAEFLAWPLNERPQYEEAMLPPTWPNGLTIALYSDDPVAGAGQRILATGSALTWQGAICESAFDHSTLQALRFLDGWIAVSGEHVLATCPFGARFRVADLLKATVSIRVMFSRASSGLVRTVF